MSIYRNLNAWPRSLVVNGTTMPLSDREVTAVSDALNMFRREQTRTGRTHSISGVAHFFGTGMLPDESAELRSWRVRTLLAERRVRSSPAMPSKDSSFHYHDESREWRPGLECTCDTLSSTL
jgi:hypothetical protein